jgi:hypothetical protein
LLQGAAALQFQERSVTRPVYIFDAIRTPRSKGKADGSLHEIKPVNRGIGVARFADRAAELARRYGERFNIKESALEKLRQSKSLEA